MDLATAVSEQDVLVEAAERAAAYLQSITARRVSPSGESVSAVQRLGGPLPEEGISSCAIVDLLDRFAAPATVGAGGGRYFGFVNGGVLPAALAADWMASAWGQNVALRVMSPAAAALEDIVLAWVTDI